MTFEGKHLDQLPPCKIIEAGIAHVPEGRQLFPRLRERQKQLAGTLSGGEQQMCAIARSLMSRPKMVVSGERRTAKT